MDSLEFFKLFTAVTYLIIWLIIYLMLLPVAEYLVVKYHPFASSDWLKVYQCLYILACMVGCYLSMYLTWG